ncbi:hypothetical protein PROFUN_08651 [Planoprotostelium fungivorum]|uniref:Uncharacterized protein n=1 Tax=Planoprotostelium fungivorum TaxID=1890364 RepID=A0A2P6NJ47_9EUKA|nr:hypothetical protein PROFUN_08651 [Planoprotostelium fungivorum]
MKNDGEENLQNSATTRPDQFQRDTKNQELHQPKLTIMANLDRLRYNIERTHNNPLLYNSLYIHVGLRGQIRNLLRSSLALIEQQTEARQTINDLQSIHERYTQEETTNRANLEAEFLDVQRTHRERERHQVQQLEALETERAELEEKMHELEEKMKAEETLNRLLFDYSKATIRTFFGWLHDNNHTEITMVQLREFFRQTDNSEVLVAMMMTNQLPLLQNLNISRDADSEEKSRVEDVNE